MYGLARNEDISFFIGKDLIQLCLGQFVFGLVFSENTSISVEAGGFTFKNKRYKGQEESHKACILHILLGKKVINTSHGKEDGDLVIEFDDGNSLTLHDDYKEFESYSFYNPQGLKVVI